MSPNYLEKQTCQSQFRYACLGFFHSGNPSMTKHLTGLSQLHWCVMYP